MNKYVLYNRVDDSVICDGKNRAVLYSNYEEAKENWVEYPEEVLRFDELPLHHQQAILKETRQK